MSFENDKYSVDQDQYEWCLRQSKILKAFEPKANIQMRNHKLLTQMPGELEHAVRFRCNHNCTLDDIANALQDVRQRTNIGKFTTYKSSGFKEKQHFRAKKKVYAIEKVPEEESQTEDSDSDSLGDAIREQAGTPQDTSNKNLCKHTQDAQTFLVTPTKGMAYIHGKATKITVCIDNAQHALIIDSGAHSSIVARNIWDNHFPNWESQLLPTKEKNFKSASGKMTFIGTIIKELIIPHRKGNIRLNPEFTVLDDAHIQGILLGTDYQRMYGIDI
ncbi:hypothetical protein O181_062362 [Austropuccinia psidii MF-1]|uniref:Uncharacterized protein n=1 Tax=Austropuccinia psidii MF-1 TaxID=1389203 RepID=A0A9Q3ES29_9BASI|nr:hypothetical protein [Austropuccinia psidii MF-1]